MNDIEILEKMIENGGDCKSFAVDESVCANCPMSKLKKRPDGSYYSCLDALGVSDIINSDSIMTSNIYDEINQKYLDEAKKILSDIKIQEMLED